MKELKKEVKKTILETLRGKGYRFTQIPGSSICYQGVDKAGASAGFSIHSSRVDRYGAFCFEITQDQCDYLESTDHSGLYLILDEGLYLCISWKSLSGYLTPEKSKPSKDKVKWQLAYCKGHIFLNKRVTQARVLVKDILERAEQPLAA